MMNSVRLDWIPFEYMFITLIRIKLSKSKYDRHTLIHHEERDLSIYIM